MKLPYFAHKDGDRVQTLIEHLTGTSLLCGEFASVFGMRIVGEVLGMYHDFGKCSPAFQERLAGGNKRVDHSTAGAVELLRMGLSAFAFCIAGHHTGLMNKGNSASLEDGTLYARIKKFKNEKSNASRDYLAFSGELPPLPDLSSHTTWKARDDFSMAFMIRMLFSCLVDADFLDTEAFMSQACRGGFDSLETIHKRYDDFISGFYPAKNSLNAKRCMILDECISKGKEQEGSLFSLTVPTGGGKTIASLGFALSHALCPSHPKRRIIYVIPYTSIIEQTADVFSGIFGRNNVVEHHSQVDFDDRENFPLEIAARHKLATENWDAPVVVTTNVQFFESLFARKSSRCRKLHNIAHSVVIFDEVQMLPIDFLLPCVRAIEELVISFGVTAVLCTATQPSLDKLFSKSVHIKEICSGINAQSHSSRSEWVEFKKDSFSSTEELADALRSHEQVLCVVNTRRIAQELSDLLGEESFHLSTLMCPVHRVAVFEEIRKRLKIGLPCRVVSTSLVEAGVDLDFPTVFRERAGLDSIVQAAGRCNRERRRSAEDSIVHVFTLEDARIPSQLRLQCEVTDSIIEDFCGEDFNKISSADVIADYFNELYNLRGASLDAKGILDKSPTDFAEIAEMFRLIDDDGESVFVPFDDAALKIQDSLRAGARDRELMRKASRYMVSVFCKHHEALLARGAVEVLDDFSVLCDMNAYHPRKGLAADITFGDGVFA